MESATSGKENKCFHLLIPFISAPPGLAAAYPRYPAPGGSQPPFGGLGLPAMAPSSHSAPSGHTIAGQHARPGPLGPPPLSSVGSPLDPRYAGYRPQTTSQAAWPLKSESSLLNHKEKERRDEEDKARRDRREAEDRRMREEAQRARESELRVSREGFPSYIKEKERNGDSDPHRDRSPIRLGSTPGSLPPNDGARTESPRVKPFDASSLVKKDSSSPRSDGAVGVDLSTSSRPSSSLSHQPLQPSDLSLKPDVSKRESVIDSDISIIGEKEGNRSGANSVTGRTSVNSDHSITRLNGLDSNSHSRDHASPLVTNGLKSDSPASKHLAGLPGVSPGYHLYPPGGHRPPAAAAPAPHQDLLGRSAYSALAHPSIDPRLAASQADSLRLAQLAQADPRLAQAAIPVDPRMDPRLAQAAMFPHMMAPSLPRPPGPFDAYAGLDPFRDAYRLDLLARDPLREARDRELMRLNPLGSLVNTELERAKALGLAGYPSLPTGAIPGYPDDHDGPPPSKPSTSGEKHI